MTSTYAPSPAACAPETASIAAPPEGASTAGDLRPRFRGSRPRSRFPRPPASEADGPHAAADQLRHALWVGPGGPLRELARDHATAAGLDLVDAQSAGPGSVAVVLSDAESLPGAELPVASDADLLVLSPDPVIGTDLWRSALEHGARAVLSVPAESEALLTHLARAARPRRRSRMVGVVGGCGGAGASSLAARLAGAGRRHGEVLLVDADPLGGGLDLLVEAPQHPGIGWQDVATVGSTDGSALRQALPRVDEVSLLTAGDGPGPDPGLLQRALHAVEPGGGTVVVDLAPALVTAAATHLDHLLVVVPSTDHAVRAAARRLRSWDLPRGLAGVAVRRRGPLAAADVADDLRLPLAMAFRDSSPGTVPLLDSRRGGADRACRSFMADLLDTSGDDHA